MTLESNVKNFSQNTTCAEPVEEINKMLLQYGLTTNQSKVYVHLTKTTEKTASELSKELQIPRTETYHLLNSLEQKGIIFSIFGKPSKFDSIPIDEAIGVLIENERKRIEELESKKKQIISLWETLPMFDKDSTATEDNRFQILQGRNSILVKIEQMCDTAKNKIQVLGSEANFIKFYHTDFVEFLKNTATQLEILTTFSEKGNYVFEELDLEHVKRLDDHHKDNFSFIIKDNTEVLFFINNSDANFMAIWTDSKSFVKTLESLFKLIWKKSSYVLEKEDSHLVENKFEHRLREIEQEKVIMNYLQKNFLLKMGGSN